MRPVRLVLREIGLRLREPFRTSTGAWDQRRILLVEVGDEDGATGWGECVAEESPLYGPETVDTAWLAITAWIAPLVLSREFTGPEEVGPALEAAFRGHHMAKAAVEMACWDLAAEQEGIPLAELLEGTRAEVATGISLGLQSSPAQLAEKATEAAAAGYRRIKLKIAPGADVEFAAAVQGALGEEVPVSVDGNGAYSLGDLEVLRRLDAMQLAMIEQPLAAGDLVRHAELQRRLSTPLCLDESITGADRAEDMITLGSGRIINVKPGRVGGHGAARAVHDVAAGAGVPVWCGGMLESGVGRAHNVALASLPNFRLPGDLSPSARYWERDIVHPEWTMSAGMVTVPRDRPGLGVEIDEEMVEELTVRRVVLTGRTLTL